MCGRVVVPKTEDLVRDLRLKLKSDRKMDRNLNVAPTMEVPVVTNTLPGDLQYFICLMPYGTPLMGKRWVRGFLKCINFFLVVFLILVLSYFN